jgi:26S proteasome regulatory subunit N2
MIHANNGFPEDPINFLIENLGGSTPQVRHGACLGLGLAALGLGTRNVESYNKLKAILNYDAITGEAAAVAMGLVMAGEGSEAAFNEVF